MQPLTLQQLVAYVWSQHRSDFYRTFWRQRGFNPETDFHSQDDLVNIPVVRKEDLMTTTLWERTAPSEQDYMFPAMSSGTTDQPLVSLQTMSVIPPYYEYITNKCQYSSVLIIRHPSSAHFALTITSRYLRPGTLIAEGDTHDLDSAAELAREIGMDHLATTPTIAVQFARALTAKAYSPLRLRFLALSGEPLTTPLLTVLNRLYPNALHLYAYGTSEGCTPLGHQSSLCDNLHTISPNAYHLNDRNVIFEVVNGTLVVTVLHATPFPLIRYDTGDRIIFRPEFTCACGFPSGPIAIIGPRFRNKSYKLGSLVFRPEHITRVLSEFSNVLTGDFALQLEQKIVGDGLVTVPSLRLRPRETLKAKLWTTTKLTSILTPTLERALVGGLYVWPHAPLRKAVENGVAEPISIAYDQTVLGSFIFPPVELMKPFTWMR